MGSNTSKRETDIAFELNQIDILDLFKDEIEFDLSPSQLKYLKLEDVVELNRLRKNINDEIEKLQSKYEHREDYSDFYGITKILPKSNKTDFLCFCYTKYYLDSSQISFRLYGYSKKLYDDWVKPEYKSSALRLYAEIIIEPFLSVDDREEIIGSKEILEQLNATPEFRSFFNDDTLVNDKGVRSIANINELFLNHISILEGGLIGKRPKKNYYWDSQGVSEAGDFGVAFVNQFGHAITVFFNVSGNSISILSDVSKKVICGENLYKINMFTNKFSAGKYIKTSTVIGDFQKFKNDLSDSIFYNTKTKQFSRTTENINETYPEYLNDKESVYTSVTMIYNNNGDLVLEQNYEDVFLPQYIPEVKKNERKNHNFVSRNVFMWGYLCNRMLYSSLKINGISKSLGNGRLLFYETLKVLKEYGYTWIVLEPACQPDITNLIELYKQWGVKNIIKQPTSRIFNDSDEPRYFDMIHMYGKIDDILAYENK
jgi:hypothetical protein